MCAEHVAEAATRPEVSTLEQAAERLSQPDKSWPDRRKGTDFRRTAALIGPGGEWEGLLESRGVLRGPRRSLISVWRMHRRGLVWNSEARRPELRDTFAAAVQFFNNYPLAPGAAQFLQLGSAEIPWNPHVVHPDPQFRRPPDGMPPELRRYYELHSSGGAGACCYARSSEWKSTADFGLPRLMFQLSLVLTGNCLYAEGAYALNVDASLAYTRMRDNGELPFGPALPPGGLFA